MELTAYNMKAKEQQPLLKAVINKNGNRYMAKGEFETGQKGCATLGKEKAEAAIAAGTAKEKGW
jgi:hypothetical protein